LAEIQNEAQRPVFMNSAPAVMHELVTPA